MVALFVHIVFGITLLVSMHVKKPKQHTNQCQNDVQHTQIRK